PGQSRLRHERAPLPLSADAQGRDADVMVRKSCGKAEQPYAVVVPAQRAGLCPASAEPGPSNHWPVFESPTRCLLDSGSSLAARSAACSAGMTPAIVSRDYSGLTPANLITSAHFAASAAMKAPNSAGEAANTVPPRSRSRALILASAKAALISRLSS